ncbi:B-box zinc finger protein [Rhynchospora pubera]|uniref:B-box zinc finger protein n=1 Tax=Rhynchospora pubera TaxID=906938 RepID=A0AAV8HWE1_9POAL|nr:B-box zinc finger protein [Rhynchospora pubera]
MIFLSSSFGPHLISISFSFSQLPPFFLFLYGFSQSAEMKIQCDVCEKAPATLICCADEAALCARCDVEVHAANKLASKHQRLLLESLPNKLPRCDICQYNLGASISNMGTVRNYYCHWCLLEVERFYSKESIIVTSHPGLYQSAICIYLLFGTHLCRIVLLYQVVFSKTQNKPQTLEAEQQVLIYMEKEKPAFIFCVEDRALFCRDCDEPIHVHGSLTGDHQRYLATGIRVGLDPVCTKDSVEGNNSEPPKSYPPIVEPKFAAVPQVASPFVPSWPVEDFLQLSDYESSDKYQKGSPLGFGELDWFSDIGLLQEQQTPTKDSPTTAEVPELRAPGNNTVPSFYKPHKSGAPFKKQRIEISSDDEEFFLVPDLG